MEAHREGTVDVEDEYFVVCELGHSEQLAKSYLRDVVYGHDERLRFQFYLISLSRLIYRQPGRPFQPINHPILSSNYAGQ